MPVLLIGCSHRTSSLDFLERVALGPETLDKTVRSLLDQTHVSEALVLSTCNRVELYVVVERFHAGLDEARQVLSETTGVPVDHLDGQVQIAYEDEAVTHLFRVAAGLESAVVGEHEIVAQLKSAWGVSKANGASGMLLHQLARHAIGVAKRARTETAIGRHTASVSQAAVALAAGQLADQAGASDSAAGTDPLDGRQVVVVGAGAMGRGMARGLAGRGAHLTIANRSIDRARVLLGDGGGQAIQLSGLADALVDADVVLSGTSASDLVLDTDFLLRVMERRAGRPLLLVDVAVPRDVDPAAGAIEGVTLLDMEDIRSFVNRGLALRQKETEAVGVIVAEELDRWRAEVSAREVTPTLVKFRAGAERVRAAEVARFEKQLSGLTPEQTAAVHALTTALVAKMLHDPTVRLKEAAGTPRGDRLLEAVRDLLPLDE